MRLEDLANKLGVEYTGNGNCELTAVATLKNADSGTISFLSNPKYKKQLEACKASAIIIHPDLLDNISITRQQGYLLSDNPYLTYARATQLLYPKATDTGEVEVSTKALIDETAIVGDNCHICAGAVLEKGCEIGESVYIGAGAVVGSGAAIGSGSIIAANVTIYHDCIIGNDCIIHSGAVIGADGFGFANEKGNWVKVEQIGRVVIGDNVEVGANTTIDRGAIEDTIIQNGVKLDNQIQIAHNVRIGKNTAIAGGTAIAGSSTIGAGCTIAGMVGITGHLSICDGVHVAAQSLVTKPIDIPGVYSSSFAADKDKSWKKKLARINMLESLFKRVRELESKIKS